MKPMTPSRFDRLIFVAANLILLAVALVLASMLVSSCMTYDQAVRKYGHLAKDSVHITVRDTVLIPKDSVTFQTHTDTTILHRIVQDGRARVIFDRTHTITTVKAECLPDTVIQEVRGDCPPEAVFGVSGFYQKGFWVLLLVLAVAGVLFKFFYTRD